MKQLLAQAYAIARLELTRVVRSSSTLIALIGFTTLLAVGQWLHWQALPPRPDDDRLFGYAFLIAAMIGLRFGFSSDRRLGIERLLVGNLIRPIAFFAGRLAAVIVVLLTFTVFTTITAGLLSAGDWRYATWYSLILALTTWLFIPVMLLAELVMDTRYPGPAVFIVFVVAVAITSITVGVQPLIDFLALDVLRLDYATLAPLAWRALLVSGVMVLIYPIWYWRLRGRVTVERLY